MHPVPGKRCTASKRLWRVLKRYTYGFGRAEDLAGIFIVVMIALSAAVAGWESLPRLFDSQPPNNIGWVIAAAILGFAGK